MSKKYILYLLLLIPTVLITNEGCRKKEPPVYNVEQETKNWMFFDTGTWWVYKELNGGMIDSHYVTKSEFIYYTHDKTHKVSPNVKVQTGLVHVNRNYVFQLASSKGGGIIEKIKYSGTEGGQTDLVFKQLFIGGYPPGASTKIIAIDNNYKFNNDTNVMLTLFDHNDGSENGDSVEYQVFKGVGIINKKNITKKENWHLINYHINLNKQ